MNELEGLLAVVYDFGAPVGRRYAAADAWLALVTAERRSPTEDLEEHERLHGGHVAALRWRSRSLRVQPDESKPMPESTPAWLRGTGPSAR